MAAEDLNELEAKLRAPDSILEPGVLDLIIRYLRAGGKADAAVEDLSENYLGYAHMCDVTCQWLEIAEVQGAAPSSGGRLTHGAGGSFSHAHGTSAAAAAAAAAGVAAGASAAAAAAGTPDEFTLLQELVKERFDSAKFLSAFKRGPPEWLNQLILDRRGRQLIYDLSAANRNSLLLGYAIQRIIKQGHADEVAQVGGSLASYFDGYHRLLATRLAAAAAATSGQQLLGIAAELAASCVASQHTYVHAQQLLHDLAGLPGGGVFQRLSQEVEAEAATRHGGVKVYQLQPLFVPLPASPAEREAVSRVSEVLVKSAPTLPGSGLPAAPLDAGGGGRALVAAQLAAVEGPLAALHGLYQQQQQLGVEPLRHPQLLQLLLSGMFAAADSHRPGASSALPADGSGRGSMRELCLQLLALAVAGRAQQGHSAAPAQQVGAQRSVSPEAVAQSPPSAEAVGRLLRQALQLAHQLPTGKLAPADLSAASEVCRQPLAALGLLQHCKLVLGEPATYAAEEKLALVVGNHLSVLHRVAWEQPGLIPQVLAVLRLVLTSLGSNRLELSQCALGLLASLVVSGAAEPAMAMAQAWAEGADPSLVRHFVLLVLGSVEPPYSPSFARAMLALMHHSLILRLKASHSQTGLLQQFAAGCAGCVFLPPLSRKDAELLEELGK